MLDEVKCVDRHRQVEARVVEARQVDHIGDGERRVLDPAVCREAPSALDLLGDDVHADGPGAHRSECDTSWPVPLPSTMRTLAADVVEHMEAVFVERRATTATATDRRRRVRVW